MYVKVVQTILWHLDQTATELINGNKLTAGEFRFVKSIRYHCH